MHIFRKGVAIVTLSIAMSFSFAQDIVRTPLPSDHPLVGTWRVDIPELSCSEIYTVRTDGTNYVMSGREQSASEFEISLEPSDKGFYKWVDKIISNNGKPDCVGNVTPVSDVSTNYIKVHPSGREFYMCQEESLNACIGPFRKQDFNV